MLKKRRLLAAKIETTAGTAETLLAANAAYNVYDLMIQPQIDVERRDGQSAFGKLPSVPGMRAGVATFRTDLQWDGTATEPAWADVFFPACGWVKSGQTYSPISESPGSNVKTITIAAYIDGVRKQLSGCMGNFVITLPTGRRGYIDWTFTGIWNAVADVSMLSSVSHPTDSPIRFASGVFSWDSVSYHASQVTIDAGNVVAMREGPSTASGLIHALVVDRSPTVSCDPESVLVSFQDRFGVWLDMVEAPLRIDLDAASTAVLEIDAPKAQFISIQESERNGIVTDDIQFQCNKNGSTADQELTFTFTNA